MAGAPREIGNRARDEILLCEIVTFNLNAVAECVCCGHKKLLDYKVLDGLMVKHGRDLRVLDIVPTLRCIWCRRRDAEILFRTGDYADDWWPRRPYNRRN